MQIAKNIGVILMVSSMLIGCSTTSAYEQTLFLKAPKPEKNELQVANPTLAPLSSPQLKVAKPAFITYLKQNQCDTANGPDTIGNVQTSKCAKIVIQNAIDTCVQKIYRYNLGTKWANWGALGVIGATGIASGAASLLHASGTVVGQVAAVTAATSSLSSNVSKVQPVTATNSVGNMESTGEAYLKIVPFPVGEDAVQNSGKYSSLYDAVFSTCPSGVL